MVPGPNSHCKPHPLTSKRQKKMANLAIALYHLNGVTDEAQLRRLKLFVKTLNVQFVAAMGESKNVREVYKKLENCCGKEKAVPLLQSMLGIIGVDSDTVSELNSSEDEQLESSKRYEHFDFGALMVSLCKSLEDDQFETLRDFFKVNLTYEPKNIEDMLWSLQGSMDKQALRSALKKHLDTMKGRKEDDDYDLLETLEKEHAKKFKKGQKKPVKPMQQPHPAGQGKPAQKSHQESQPLHAVAGHRSDLVIGRQKPVAQHRPIDGDDDDLEMDRAEPEVPGEANVGENGDREDNRPGNMNPELEEPKEEQGELPEQDGDGPFSRKMNQSDNTMARVPTLTLYDETKGPVYAAPVSRPESLSGFYRMENHEHGVALVISIENIAGRGKRNGTKIDEENLKQTFRFLGYRMEIKHDCMLAKINEIFSNIDKIVRQSDDSFVCCILSHGGNNYFRTKDDKMVFLRTVDGSLERRVMNQPRLRGKLKLFFMSCCRGGAAEAPAEKDDDIPASLTPRRSGFAFYYSTLTREASSRYEKKGTVYINRLCYWLCKHATNTTLSDIHKCVAKQVASLPGIDDQVPCCEEQLLSNIYFFDDMVKDPVYK